MAVTDGDALAVGHCEPLAVMDGDGLGDGLPVALSERWDELLPEDDTLGLREELGERVGLCDPQGEVVTLRVGDSVGLVDGESVEDCGIEPVAHTDAQAEEDTAAVAVMTDADALGEGETVPDFEILAVTLAHELVEGVGDAVAPADTVADAVGHALPVRDSEGEGDAVCAPVAERLREGDDDVLLLRDGLVLSLGVMDALADGVELTLARSEADTD